MNPIIKTTSTKKYAIIMAGGSGTRMNSTVPKQLLKIGNKPMLMLIIDNISQLDIEIVLVVSEQNKAIIIDTLLNYDIVYLDTNKYFYKNVVINLFIQKVANGTGGAIMSTREFFKDKSDNNILLILSADVPLISKDTINIICDKINSPFCSCVIMCNYTNNNYGYGRIITQKDIFENIIEEKDCTIEQKAIKLVNTGTYAFKLKPLMNTLDLLSNNNSQEEYYLTDCPLLIKNNSHVNAIRLHVIENQQYNETLGANTPEQLEQLRLEYLKKFSIEQLNCNHDITKLFTVLNQLHSNEKQLDIDEIFLENAREYIRKSTVNSINKKFTYIVKYENDIIGTGSILIEQKLIHNFGKVGHIEDVVIDKDYRCLGLASKLILKLIEIAKTNGCYKIILNTLKDTTVFYEKLGFVPHSTQLRLNLNVD